MQEIEQVTANNWLALGTVQVVEQGNENTYYCDQFDNRFFCKHYPD